MLHITRILYFLNIILLYSLKMHLILKLCLFVCFQCQPTALLRTSDSMQGGEMASGVVYFWFTHRLGRPYYVWDEYLYGVLEKVAVRVTVSVTVCVVLLCCVQWWWKEGRRWNPVPAHSLLFSKGTERTARLNVPIRRTNRYQQYYMPSQHTYCGRVWNLFQSCDVQSSD